MNAVLKGLPAIITTDEIAELLRTDEETVVGMFEDGSLKGFRVGKEWRAKKEDLERLIDGDDVVSDTAKIGEHVKTSMAKLFQSCLIPDLELKMLTSPEYCKKIFGVSFPVLKELPENYRECGDLSQYMNDDKGYARYWKMVFGEKYLVTSQWYERHRRKFDHWLKNHL